MTDKKRILLVEDDKLLRDLMVFKLESEGYTVLEATTVETALEQTRQRHPDLIFLDIILPGKDGFLFLEEIKQDPRIAHIPVVVLSNLGQDSEVKKGLDLGAKDYLIKAHFTPSEIVEKIKEVMAQ